MKRGMTTLSAAALTLIGTTTWSVAKDDTPNPAILPEVVVTGKQEQKEKTYLSKDLSINKYTRPLLDTPQSITVVPRQLLDDQHITTMRDAIRNVAGISLAAGEGGAQGDNLTLRGFAARSDIFLDGMRDFGSYYRDAFNWERVEVLKGPSSISFGRGSTGGVVNQVSKSPESKAHKTADISVGNTQKARITADINEPLPQLGKGSALRLNVSHETSHVTDRNKVNINHLGIAPSLALGLESPTRLTFHYLFEQADDLPDYGIPYLFNKPADVDRNNFYGFKSDFLKTRANIATFKGEHDLSDAMTLRDQFRYGHYTRKMRASEAKISGSPTLSTDPSTISVTRSAINTDSTETFLQNQLDLTSKFKTGELEHTLITGTEIGYETSSPTRYTITGVPGTNLLHPDEDQTFSGTNTAKTVTTVKSDSLAVYAINTVKINDQWEMTGGARWDRFHTDYKQEAAKPLDFEQTDSFTSLRGALVYKPIEEGSIYVGYGTSFNPSAESLSLSASTENLDPEDNRTYEIGTKWELFKKKLLVRSAIFRTEKRNARETDPTNSSITVLSGNQRVEGLEIEAAGHLTDKWQVTTGYAYMKSKVVSSKYFPDAVGSPLANVPENSFNIWTTYDLPGNFQIGGGGNFVDKRRASSTVPNDPTTGLPKEVPSYWVFNAMLAYHMNQATNIQLNIYNLTDVTYYDNTSRVTPGEGRSAVLSMTVKF